MFNKAILAAVCALFASTAWGQLEVPVTGTVESKCVITTDTVGIYGNPLPGKLSTAQADGGVQPIIRFDVLQADFYKARVVHPNTFSESPSLSDTITWTGDTTVAEVSDAQMSAYDQNKIEFDNVTEVDLSVAGSTWFQVASTATYGVGKAFPAGTYRTIVGAECIAL
jgi:hypothetical protein